MLADRRQLAVNISHATWR